MNILFVCSSSDWHMCQWLKYFTDRHKVWIFSDREDYLIRRDFGERVEVIEDYGYFGRLLGLLNNRTLTVAHLNKMISSRRFRKLINKIIDDYHVDIVHAHSLYYGYLSAGVREGIPVVFTPMGSDIIIHAQKHPVYKYMARKAFARADVVTGDSLLLRRQGCKVGAREEHNYIVQNGVDTEIFFPRENEFKKQLGVKDGGILIFSPRALEELYNIDVILKSLALLRDAGYNVKCMFTYAFGGEYLQSLKEIEKEFSLEDNVIWLGYKEYREMADLYNASDIVVSVPSTDSSPKSVYEAMFCRKPVIVSDLEWSHELLGGCDCLQRVKVRDPFDLFSAIRYLIDNREHADQMAARACEAAVKYFDYYDNMKKMESIMLDCISGLL